MTYREVGTLVQLLGGHFHEGWAGEHPTAEDCLDEMLREASVEQKRRGARQILRLLDGSLCETQIRDVLLYEVGCHYAYERDGLDASGWLRHVLDRMTGGDAPVTRPGE